MSFLLPLAVLAAPVEAQQAPRAVLDELLKSERQLSEAAAKLGPAEGIASLLAPDGVLFTRPAPAIGPAAAVQALKTNPANQGQFARWRSIKAGVSADGQHGFTLGYLDIDGGAPTASRRRYLAYWVRGQEGWRVAALRQAIRGPNEADIAAQAPTLPARAVPPEPAKSESLSASLISAEKAFSDRAQVVGLQQAFRENGQADAIHLSSPSGFAVGLSAVLANFASEPPGPAPLNWSADRALVASSGDLGLTMGTIRTNGPPPEGQPASVPFFTVWYREDQSKPWRYIAE